MSTEVTVPVARSTLLQGAVHSFRECGPKTRRRDRAVTRVLQWTEYRHSQALLTSRSTLISRSMPDFGNSSHLLPETARSETRASRRSRTVGDDFFILLRITFTVDFQHTMSATPGKLRVSATRPDGRAGDVRFPLTDSLVLQTIRLSNYSPSRTHYSLRPMHRCCGPVQHPRPPSKICQSPSTFPQSMAQDRREDPRQVLNARSRHFISSTSDLRLAEIAAAAYTESGWKLLLDFLRCPPGKYHSRGDLTVLERCEDCGCKPVDFSRSDIGGYAVVYHDAMYTGQSLSTFLTTPLSDMDGAELVSDAEIDTWLARHCKPSSSAGGGGGGGGKTEETPLGE